MATLIRPFKRNTEEDYLDSVFDITKWINSFSVKKSKGKAWKLSSGEGSSEGDQLAVKLNDRTIYSGAAGIGYFYVQLYEITGDKKYLAEAILAGEYLIDTFDEELGNKPGIHTGLAGEGYFAELLYKKTNDNRFRDYAIKTADTIYEKAHKDENGIYWNGIYDYMGDGSAINYWLFIYDITKDSKYLDYAKQGIDYIITLKTYEDDKEAYWKFFDMHDYFETIPAGGIVSNFAHGTSGIVYILTKYYEASKEQYYLDLAKKGFTFLKRIAIDTEDASIVPYIYYEDPNKTFDVYYLSLCHGPVGTGVVVNELYKATGDEEYKEYFDRFSNALIDAGVDSKRSAGYWNDCVCCGSSGVLLHFVTGYKNTGNEKYKDYAIRIADKLIGDAFKDDKGTRWYNAWTRVIPWNVDSHLGLYIGSAGSASALLSLYAAIKGIELTGLYEF